MDESTQTYSAAYSIKRWSASLIIFLLALYFMLHRGEYTLIDTYHLIVHEAGHFILGFMGYFIMMMGGTIMQLLVPAMLMLYSFLNRMRVIFQFSFFLLGHSFLNVSVYAADAQAMKLRLFGPPGAKHDWNTVLSLLGILEYTPVVAIFFVLMAGACFILAVLAPAYFSD